jgi:PEGA domain
MRIAVLGLVLLALPGCATIMASGPDHIPVATNPPGATVIVDGVPVGTTPTVIALNRETSSGNIQIQMPGFRPIVFFREKSINGWFWANLCLGGVLGIVIDVVTGDVKMFDDTPIRVGLTPDPGYPQAYPPQPPPPGYPPPPPGYPQQQPPPPQGYPQQQPPPPPEYPQQPPPPPPGYQQQQPPPPAAPPPPAPR